MGPLNKDDALVLQCVIGYATSLHPVKISCPVYPVYSESKKYCSLEEKNTNY